MRLFLTTDFLMMPESISQKGKFSEQTIQQSQPEMELKILHRLPKKEALQHWTGEQNLHITDLRIGIKTFLY